MENVCSQVVPGSDSSCKWESVGTENGYMESVCSQVVSGSDSSCKWESVGTENGSVTDVLKLRGVLTKSSK